MSSFNNNGVTLKGAVIIASLVAGDTLTFTRISVGDGVLPSGQTVLTTEKLVNPLFDVPISSVESDSVAHATVKGAFNNADLDTGFYYRELGLFAINPVTKAEELFCYGNAGDEAEWINAVGESSLVEKEIHLVTLIGNATTVTANFDPKAPALKSEMDAILPLKADLDATPENGGRVLAKQMRFDKTQTLYVNASAAAGGDGTESKPFKTIQEAVDARYRGASNAIINIAPGEYNEVISISNIAGLAWTFQRNGTGVAKVKSLAFGNCSHISITDLTIEPESSFGISLNNVASAYLTGIAINGTTASNGFSISLSRAVIFQTTINNTNIAVATGNNSQVTMVSVAGTGNNLVVSADASVITMANNTIVGTNKYDKLNGGVINVEGGGSSFPSNYSQLYYLGSVATAESLKTILLTEFVKLKERESRTCSFANNIPEGLGPFQGGQNMYVDIVKNSSQGNGFGVVFVRAHFEPAAGYWIIQNGAFITDVPKVFAVVEPATPASYGLMRVAAPVVDELDSTCSDAALTPANVHAMANYRIANKYYNVGDVVAVPYHANLFMECITAGRSDSEPLVTIDAYDGQQIIDGGVTWEVGVVGKTPGEIVMYMGDTAPEGYLACDHGEVSRTTYARLFRIRGTKDGAGNGSTTFNLPNMNNGSFAEGSNTAGTIKGAGLPNILGKLSNVLGNPLQGIAVYNYDRGAFNVTQTSGTNFQLNDWKYVSDLSTTILDNGGIVGDTLNLNAHDSSAIYGSSDTVQPKAVTVKFCIKY